MSILNTIPERFIPANSFFERFIDHVIVDADEFEYFHLSTLVESFKIGESDKMILSNAIPEFESFLKKRDIIETNKQLNLVFNLTDFGRECKSIGGYLIFIKQKSDKAFADKKREERKDKSDELDLSKKSWEYKYRHLPYIISSAALIGTLFSIFINYNKPLVNKQDQTDLQSMKQQIQIMQDKMNTRDSFFRVDTFLRKDN